MLDLTKGVGNLDAALSQGKTANFALTNANSNLTSFGLLPAIPKNYYCKWRLSLNSLHVYYLKI